MLIIKCDNISNLFNEYFVNIGAKMASNICNGRAIVLIWKRDQSNALEGRWYDKKMRDHMYLNF